MSIISGRYALRDPKNIIKGAIYTFSTKLYCMNFGEIFYSFAFH